MEIPKDKIPMLRKSEIYKINCNKCYKKYVDQIKKKIIIIFKENLAHIKYDRPDKPCIAKHILKSNHDLVTSNKINNL